MSFKFNYWLTQGLFTVVALVCAPAAAASTLCTHIVQSPEYPIPIDERESDRQVQARVLPGFVADGDKLAGEGNRAGAVETYARVLSSGFSYEGTYTGDARCLPTDFYQEVADKLRTVASRLAEQRRAKGQLLDESGKYRDGSQRGALWLYLISNQYDTFLDRAFEYAESELPDRDIDSELTELVRNRLDDLQRLRGTYAKPGNRSPDPYVSDLTPLLDEELAAFDRLDNFEEQLRAHLAPLYPKITDHLLAEEERHFDDAIEKDGAMLNWMIFSPASSALERGVKRLSEHPVEVDRLTARANARGRTLMAREQYTPAGVYFEIAGNDDLAARTSALAEKRVAAMAEQMEAAVKSDLEKFQKSEEEKAAFQDDADEMAAEFGFDLED